MEKPTGKKFDTGKIRLDLIPPAALAALGEVLRMGANKYADDHNWRKGVAYSRLYASAQRHLTAWATGEKRCPQDGQLHLGSVLSCVAMLCEFEAQDRTDLDDLTIWGPDHDEILGWVKGVT